MSQIFAVKLPPSLHTLQMPLFSIKAYACLMMLVLLSPMGQLFAEGGKGGALSGYDLDVDRVRLSYVDPGRCIQMLQVFGFHIGQAGKAVDVKKLPCVVQLPSTGFHQTVVEPGKNFPLTDTDPLNELLVFYHPDKPEQLSRVVDVIRSKIDVPARQIMIEAMVLEISNFSLKDLGVEWELSTPGNTLTSLTLGELPSVNNFDPTLALTSARIFGEFNTKLQALVEEGEAEVLSRPSVLTLDNRMAYINVSQKIPVAEGKLNRNGEVTSINFREKTAGIQLGVRPRVSGEGHEIGMQITASVTAIVPNAEVELRNSQGDLIATSPTLSVREVKTYARIANNTPFIIGGLVAKDDIVSERKVPILGDLPLLGNAFKSRNKSLEKREVIIVITPFVLPEDDVSGRFVPDDNLIGRNLPKDEDAFDSFGHKLFRDAYRIRDSDVFDLSFLTENDQLKEMQSLADEALRNNVLLEEEYPWRNFVGGRFPGEDILVFRQMYEVIKRIGLESRLNEESFILFVADEKSESGFRVEFFKPYVESLLTSLDGGLEMNDSDDKTKAPSLEERLAGRAIALTYTLRRDSREVGGALEEPVPEVQLVDCPDSATFDRLLWEMNQPSPDGQERFTLLLRRDKDLVRLKRAILLRETVELNSSRKTLTLNNFSVGRLLLLPARKTDKVDLIDANVAKYFFYSEQYYPVLRQSLEKDIAALQKAASQ